MAYYPSTSLPLIAEKSLKAKLADFDLSSIIVYALQTLGGSAHCSDVYNWAADYMRLTDEDRSVCTAAGVVYNSDKYNHKALFENRIQFACIKLRKTGYVVPFKKGDGGIWSLQSTTCDINALRDFEAKRSQFDLLALIDDILQTDGGSLKVQHVYRVAAERMGLTAAERGIFHGATKSPRYQILLRDARQRLAEKGVLLQKSTGAKSGTWQLSTAALAVPAVRPVRALYGAMLRFTVDTASRLFIGACERLALSQLQDAIRSENTGACYVYTIEDPRDCAVKIGFSHNVDARLSSLNTGHSTTTLQIIDYVKLPNEDTARAVEQALHQRFSASHRLREWFNLTDEILDFIGDMQSTVIDVQRAIAS